MRVLMIGGDERMLYAAQAFREAGAEVRLSGFEKTELPGGTALTGLNDSAGWADIVVLPVRPVKDGTLFAPYAAHAMTLHELGAAAGHTPVFTGDADSVRACIGGPLYDYAAREEFAVHNAVLTAEGAIGLLVDRYAGSISGAKALVTGYGRIGRILTRDLRALGAEVTVAVRRADARAWAMAEGMQCCDYSLEEIKSYDILINTVPAPVLTADHLARVRRDAILIDLASAPGGIDAQRAGERGLSLIRALALPGRTAPAAAGRIVKETICSIIKEENGGKDYCGLCDDRLLLHL